MNGSPSQRRHDVDWLRVFATYLLFLFHVVMVFNPAPFYHIRNDEVSFVFLITAGFIGLWHMPLFFLLAGWAIHSSLQQRGTAGFLRERFHRLFVPLVAGCALLMPPIKYLELKNGMDANYTGLYVTEELQGSFTEIIPSGLPVAAPFRETFTEFLPSFFTQPERFTWAHLWFVVYLLTFTLLYLPLIVQLSRRRTWQTVRPWWVYAPILPLALVQVTLRPLFPGLQNLYADWANFAYYSTFLLVGFLLARQPAFEAALHHEWRRALGIGLLATLALLAAVLGLFSAPPVLLALTAVAGWCFIVALLGFAHARLRFSNRWLDYLAESAFPVYLLHQSAIVLIGYPLIHTHLGMTTKFLLLLFLAPAATVAVYEFLVRRHALARVLCGMKRRPGSSDRSPALVPTAAALLLTALLLVPGSGQAGFDRAGIDRTASPEGVWYAEGGAAKVEIFSCGDALCGRVVWLRSPFDENGCELRDRQNPDPDLRGQPVLGLRILKDLRPSGMSQWDGGEIYDPGTGNTYSASLSIGENDRIEVRGYLGIHLLGRTTTWIRVGSEEAVCRATT